MTNISDENIRIAAYYIWEQAGSPEGKEKECWIKACEQLFACKTGKKTAVKSAVKPAAKVAAKPVAKAPVVAKSAVKPAAKTTAKPAVSASAFYGVKKK